MPAIFLFAGSTRKRYTAGVGKSVSSQGLDGVCTGVVVRGESPNNTRRARSYNYVNRN